MSFIKGLRGLGKHSIRDLQTYQTSLDFRLNSFHISSDQSGKGVLRSVRRGELSNIVCNVFTMCRRFLFRRRQAEPSNKGRLNFCRTKRKTNMSRIFQPNLKSRRRKYCRMCSFLSYDCQKELRPFACRRLKNFSHCIYRVFTAIQEI